MPCLRLYLFAATLLLSMAASLPLSTQTLPIVMTASDTPTTTGIPNKGGEGFRFLGFRLEPRTPSFCKGNATRGLNDLRNAPLVGLFLLQRPKPSSVFMRRISYTESK